MKFLFYNLLAVTGLAVAGCASVRAARETQARLEPLAAGASQDVRIAPDFSRAPLRALVEYAHAHRPSMASAALAVKDARLALKEIAADAPLASATPWNAVGLNGSFGYSESSAPAHFEDLDHTRRGKASGGLSLDLLIWDFGRNAARAKAQSEAVLAAELALAQEGYAIFDEVAQAYFRRLREAALTRVAETNLAACAERLDQVQRRKDVGEAIELDVVRARLDVATARESLVAASNAVVTAGADLLAAIGIDAALGTAETVLGAPEVDPANLTGAFAPTDLTAEANYRFAVTNAPAPALARAKLRAASARVDAAVADLKPSVSASLGLNWTDPLWYWQWGVNATQSLFTGFRKTTAVERATVAMESAATDVEKTEQDLSQAIATAVAERDDAAAQQEPAETRCGEAERNLALVRARAEIGEATRIDVSDALASLSEAQGSRIRAFYRRQIAEARLFRLRGTEPEYRVDEFVEEEAK